MITDRVLLCRRSDGLFLRLDEDAQTTSCEFVPQPELAKRIHLYDPGLMACFIDPAKLHEPSYYFENSDRARDWTKDCVMVCYEIVTEARELQISDGTPSPTCK